MRLPLALLLLAPATVRAAPPTVTYLFPAGAQQGTLAEVQAAGTFDPWPVDAWCSAKGVEVHAGKAKGALQVKVAADAPAGLYWIRLFNADGASRLCPFFVGTLPELTETEPNDDPKKPQRLAGSECVVNGRLTPANDVDHFAVPLKKGQTLVASVEANRTLGSPMDAVMHVLSPQGFVAAENNDTHGLDPQIAFPAPRDGDYVVRLFAFPATPDSGIRFAGGETFVYRLTLTTGGYADHAFPLAVSLKDPGPVRLAGWNLPDAARAIALRPDAAADAWPVRAEKVANAAFVRVEPHATAAE